jgi:hypothetical protein
MVRAILLAEPRTVAKVTLEPLPASFPRVRLLWGTKKQGSSSGNKPTNREPNDGGKWCGEEPPEKDQESRKVRKDERPQVFCIEGRDEGMPVSKVSKGLKIEGIVEGIVYVLVAVDEEGAGTQVVFGVTMVTELMNPGMVGSDVAADRLSVFVGPVGGTPMFTLATPHKELLILSLLPLSVSVGFEDCFAVSVCGIR